MQPKDWLLSWGMLLVGVVMNGAGIAVIKVKMNTLGKLNLDSVAGFLGYFLALAKAPMPLLGMIAVLVAPIPLAVALSRMEVSVAVPVATALNFLVLIPLSILLLNETFTVNKMLAIVLIVASVYLLYK